MSLSPLEYLRHILDECNYILNRTKSLDKDQFMHDETLKRAFIRSLEIIGEAAKQVPDDFKQKYGQVQWKAMAGMRDKLIHGYLGVDYDLVWDTAINKIPILQQQLEQILQKESGNREG